MSEYLSDFTAMKKYIPKVYLYPEKSPYWIGVFYAFDVRRKDWIRIRKTTECVEKSAALAVTQEWQRLAKEVTIDNSMTREKAMESVNFILRLAGIPTFVENPKWVKYSQNWLFLFETSRKDTLPDGETDRTVESYKSHLKTFTGWLGDDRQNWGLLKFDGSHLQDCYNTLLDEGRSPKTVKNILKTVSLVFSRAVDEKFLTVNPVDLVMRRTADIDRTRLPFTQQDLIKIVKYLTHRQHDPVMQDWLTMVYLSLCTARRLEDCSNAGWQHFDLTAEIPIWTLRPRKARGVGKVEKIPIVEPLASHLRQIHKGASNLLLCPSLGTRLSDQFGEILIAAGVKVDTIPRIGEAGRDFKTKSFHSFRHTLTSRLAEAGVDQRLSKKIVGHLSDKVHEGYTHMEIKTMAEAMQKCLA